MEGKYIFHSDAGHGWLAVKRTELDRLGLVGLISDYSYEHDDMVYLEEDVDAGLFIKAAGLGQDQIVGKDDGDASPIRAYASYATK